MLARATRSCQQTHYIHKSNQNKSQNKKLYLHLKSNFNWDFNFPIAHSMIKNK